MSYRRGTAVLARVQPVNRRAALATARAASTATTVPPETAANVLRLASNLKSLADVEDLVINYGVKNAHVPGTVRPLAVVKVGGEIIAKDLKNLVASLKFLRDSGLFPVVIHGGGPQLNDELAKAGVKPEYIGGHRVTDPATMAVAKRVFEAANGDLAAGLRAAGLPTEQLLGGIFGAEVHDPKLGLVGEIKKVTSDPVLTAVAAGRIPVLTSLGLSSGGQVLNINADVAARELAIALKPLRIVFVSAGGGWKENNEVVPQIDMAQDFDRLENRDYTGRQGTLLKLREMKQIVDALPASASLTLASPSALAAQILPHRGPGTQIRKGVKIAECNSLGSTDATRLEALLRSCGAEAGAALVAAGGNTPSTGPVTCVLTTAEYTAAALVTQPPGSPVPLLHTLAVSPLALSEGVEGALWTVLHARFPALAWAATPSKDISAAAAEVAAKGPASIPAAFPSLSTNRSGQHATGHAGAVMWRGVKPDAVPAVVSAVTAATGITVTSPAPAGSAAAKPAVAKTDKAVRVGLLGARGFVGRELLKLFAAHPNFQVVCASSRALVGQDVAEGLGVPEAAAAVAPGLTFSDVGPEQLAKGAHPAVDAWVLALPNGLCATHAAAIDKRCAAAGPTAVKPLLIDLSADMRFDTTGSWTYGLPERPGAREALRTARKISNPGCYATGAQAALLPLLPGYAPAGSSFAWSFAQKPHVFGVSGYSGAGTTPSDKNDPNKLRDNLLAYSLVNHIHEREVGHHCRIPGGIAFMPHVAPFFQGIHLTVTGHLGSVTPGGAFDPKSVTAAAIRERYEAFYKGEKLMRVLAGDKSMPDVRTHGTFQHGVTVGGFTYDPATGRLALVSTIDNLLKGAATQAVQNMNLALGLPEYEGIPTGSQ